MSACSVQRVSLSNCKLEGTPQIPEESGIIPEVAFGDGIHPLERKSHSLNCNCVGETRSVHPPLNPSDGQSQSEARPFLKEKLYLTLL
jgi:hypothetical protein